MKSKKAFIFTLDSILGLIILIVLFSFPFFFLTNVNSSVPTREIVLANDITKVLIDSDLLKDAISSSDYSSLELYLNESVPEQFASFVRIYNSSSLIKQVNSSSCKLNENYVSKGTLYVDEFYSFEVVLC